MGARRAPGLQGISEARFDLAGDAAQGGGGPGGENMGVITTIAAAGCCKGCLRINPYTDAAQDHGGVFVWLIKIGEEG